MFEKKTKKILISAVGTTDPVRGYRDGPMLHIMRNYKPDKVLLFLTKEMQEINTKNDDFYSLAIENLKEHLEGYEPTIEMVCLNIEDASDFDAFYESFEKCFVDESNNDPEAELLINISSGTPQMKITLAFLANDTRFNAKAIQVKNPEGKSGSKERSNSKKYDAQVEIEFNEDNEPNAANRCVENSQYLLIKREKNKEVIKSLLDKYEYRALYEMQRSNLPEKTKAFVIHLMKRAAYDYDNYEDAKENGKKLEKNLALDFKLYPHKKTCKNQWLLNEYGEISEYFMCLKLLYKKKDFTQLVLRLNPLILRLQTRYLEKECGLKLIDITNGDRNRMLIKKERIEKLKPDLMTFLNSKFNDCFRDESDISIPLCCYLIEYFEKLDTDEGRLFDALRKLNQVKRNETAHNLANTTEDEIRDISGYSASKIVSEMETLISNLYDEVCDSSIFDIYDKCNDYLKKQIGI